MKCVNPRLIRVYYKDQSPEAIAQRIADGNTTHPQYYSGHVPCGKCYQCLSFRRRQWQFRLKKQAEASAASFFLTFTRSDDYNNLKMNELDKSELQYIFKYLRLKGYKFKYYAIGEYGTHTFRAHYHALLFFDKLDDQDTFLHHLKNAYSLKYNEGGVWHYIPKGFISCYQCTGATIGYITHYHVRPKIPAGCTSTTPAFNMYSQGLGNQFIYEKTLDYLSKSKDKVVRDLEGNIYRLPRYYRKKYNIEVNTDDMQLWSSRFMSKKEFLKWLDMPVKEQNSYQRMKQLADKQKLKCYNKQIKSTTI